jgi:endoglucanase
MKKIFVILIALLFITGFATIGYSNSSNTGSSEIRNSVNSGVMRNITTAELILDMGLGINLGNTLEAVSPWVNNPTIASLETSWGSPRITRQIIQGYKAAGFNTLRIPVAWSNLMDLRNYTIHPTLLNRVQEIVDWTLEAGMYAIINLHWDGGWLANFPTDYNESMRRYTRIWEQVTERFKNYGDYLLFESQNEELGWDSLWNPWGAQTGANRTGKVRAYEIVNAINQRFVDIVRNSGGNNGQRHLLIAGYHTNIDRTIDSLFNMPNDPVNRMAVKVHYYDPFSFTHLEQNESWARATWTWGTTADYAHLNNELNKMVTNFINRGIPVVIGEYGMAKQGVTQEQITNYTLAVTEAMFSRGMLPILWCVQLQQNQLNFYYNRRVPGMTDPLLERGLKAIAASR